MIYLFPFISALIGWITNYIAIKMLFHPRNEVRFLGIRFQGIFPKRQKTLARKLAVIVARDLFTTQNIKDKIEEEVTIEEMRKSVEREVETYLRKQVERAPIIATFVDDKRINQIRDRICQEVDVFLPQVMQKIGEKVEKVDVEETVYQKVSTYSSEKLEYMLMGVLKGELKFIELAGALLGFVIGLLQVFLLTWLG
jgi:uncharacterized membrane protein YheB (UPF0754 family)